MTGPVLPVKPPGPARPAARNPLLIRLIVAHPRFELAYVGSRELDGQRLADHIDAYRGELRYSSPANAALPVLAADAVVLALPNGKAAACDSACDHAVTARGHLAVSAE